MAREWTRKSIEEIMKAVIAREGGGGGSVDWVSELAKSLQNENFDPSHMTSGVPVALHAPFVYFIELPSGVTPSSLYNFSGLTDDYGLFAGKYVSGDLNNPVQFDEMYIILPAKWGSGYSPVWFPVGTKIYCFYEISGTTNRTAYPLSKVYYPTISSDLVSEKTISSYDNETTAKFSITSMSGLFEETNDNQLVLPVSTQFVYGIKIEITNVNNPSSNQIYKLTN